jgi:hypothetical protein
MNSNDIKRGALIILGYEVLLCVLMLTEKLVERLGGSSDVSDDIIIGAFAAWLVVHFIRNRNRKHRPDALQMKYGRFSLAGLATSWVVQALVGRVASFQLARIVAMMVLAVWVAVVDFLYRRKRRSEMPSSLLP